MPIALLLTTLGLGLLVLGGDLLVRGASGIALRTRLSPTVIGLTIVAAGTSMPEFVVSMRSAMRGLPEVAVANVLGSNIFNVAAILGVVALLRPLRIEGNTVRLEWPVMMLATLLFSLLARDGTIDRPEGALLTAGMVAFMAYAVWVARRGAADREHDEFEATVAASTGTPSWVRLLATTAAGAALLATGADVLVRGAVDLAARAGVSERIIGLTVIAAGTSLPELTTSCVAAMRGRDDVAVANVIGSNIFNLLGILGPTAMLLPLHVSAEVLRGDALWAIGTAGLLFPLMRSGMRITRMEGGILLAVYAGWLATLFTAR